VRRYLDDGPQARTGFVVTGNHPFWVKNVGWTRADHLIRGQFLELPDGSTCEVYNRDTVFRTDVEGVGWLDGSINALRGTGLGRTIDLRGDSVVFNDEQVAHPEIDPADLKNYLRTRVYNFEIEDNHTYYVGDWGVWVHNADGQRTGRDEQRCGPGRDTLSISGQTSCSPASKPKADASARMAELQREVENLAEAIAGGLLKSSPTLAKRLVATESELSRLQAQRNAKAPVMGEVMPRVAESYQAIVDRLEEDLTRDPERARAALTDAIGSRITLEPDESGKFLWAEFGLETAPLLVSVGMPEFMVAGGRYELYSNYPLQIQAVAVSIAANA
jgi:hypothetical protein